VYKHKNAGPSIGENSRRVTEKKAQEQPGQEGKKEMVVSKRSVSQRHVKKRGGLATPHERFDHGGPGGSQKKV